MSRVLRTTQTGCSDVRTDGLATPATSRPTERTRHTTRGSARRDTSAVCQKRESTHRAKSAVRWRVGTLTHQAHMEDGRGTSLGQHPANRTGTPHSSPPCTQGPNSTVVCREGSGRRLRSVFAWKIGGRKKARTGDSSGGRKAQPPSGARYKMACECAVRAVATASGSPSGGLTSAAAFGICARAPSSPRTAGSSSGHSSAAPARRATRP